MLHQLPSPRSLAIKRFIDLVFAAVCLVLLSPVLAMIALAILVDSGRPVIYGGQRRGRHGQPFRMYKFRTMTQDAEARLDEVLHLNQAEGNQVKIHQDPRQTRIGPLLRRTSLDELPNLWNVIRGEMSLVGPRPHTLQEYPEATPELLARLEMWPGITGSWQVIARNSPSEAKRAYWDRRYIATWSLGLDLRIALRTFGAVLQCDGSEPGRFELAPPEQHSMGVNSVADAPVRMESAAD